MHDQVLDSTLLGTMKIAFAWILVALGSLNFTVFLTLISLTLASIFTGLQIYKIWKDIRRQHRIDMLEMKLQEKTHD
jgi:hypothetical protein